MSDGKRGGVHRRVDVGGAALSARWVRNAIDMAGISQGELARRMNVGHGYVSRIVSGKYGCASLDTILRALEACGLEVIELRVKKPAAKPIVAVATQ